MDVKTNHSIYNLLKNKRVKARTLSRLAVTAGLTFFVMTGAYGQSESRFAESSRLSEGKWVKISVSETGMQYISDSSLQQMGFSDPKKVRVYGFGGRMLSENLSPSNPDDLPEQISGRTANGLYFFAYDWSDILPNLKSGLKWKHVLNPYSESSYYFLSDSNTETATKFPTVGTPEATLSPVTTFDAHLFHEIDEYAPSTTGRILLGEDFRSQPTVSVNFQTPDIASDEVAFKVRAAVSVTGGFSSFTFNVNGNPVTANSNDRIQSISGDSQFMKVGDMVHTVNSVSGNQLKLDIKHSCSGFATMARLDYIELEYKRHLTIPASSRQLYFYENLTGATTFSIGNASADWTEIWDVTDPMRPARVDFTVTGGRAVFTIDAQGMKRFVAFNHGEFSNHPVAVGNISNQNLHAIEAPDYLIITPPEYRSQAEAVADLHRKKEGMSVLVLEPEIIYNEFSSGTPDVTAFRKLLQMWNLTSLENNEPMKTAYCLIFSRPTYDNKLKTPIVRDSGYPRIPIWQSPEGNSQTTSYSTDDYIGMLDDSEIFNISAAKIHVAVGRMPAKSTEEADILVKKLTDYITNPTLGAWRNSIMLIADDQDNGVHLEQTQTVYNNLRSKGNGNRFLYERLYLDSYPLSYGATGAAYPEAQKRMFDKWKEGVMMIYYIGHASTRSWSHEGLLTWGDILKMTNTNLPFLYAATCEFGRYDDDTSSGAEELLINPNGGVIATIVPARTVYISPNGTLSKATSSVFFERTAEGKAKRIGDIMIQGKNGYGVADDNKLRYVLIGDPALRIASPELNVIVSKIDDTDVEGIYQADSPVLGARSKTEISGYVADRSGNIIEDFNGVVSLSLYDAERVITTYGNGAAGKVSEYNDRKTRLYTGRATVKDGKWKITTTIPYEIENNYSPALISLYAYDDQGREANGMSEKLYVYGYAEDATDDAEGPEIKSFYLNNENFRNGQLTHSAPLVVASFTDPSGINQSEAGIGHRITLTLDGKVAYDDLQTYYIPDLDNSTGGSIAYPLSDIQPGYHYLDLKVWDTANNSSSRRIEFQVGANVSPELFDVTCTGSVGGEEAVFTLITDRPSGRLKCSVEVFALDGKKVWSGESETGVAADSSVKFTWDLKDNAGRRVPRGIYVYRAGVTTDEGQSSYKSNKLAVSGE